MALKIIRIWDKDTSTNKQFQPIKKYSNTDKKIKYQY